MIVKFRDVHTVTRKHTNTISPFMLEKVLSAKGINYFCDIRATVADTSAKRKDYYSSAKKVILTKIDNYMKYIPYVQKCSLL